MIMRNICLLTSCLLETCQVPTIVRGFYSSPNVSLGQTAVVILLIALLLCCPIVRLLYYLTTALLLYVLVSTLNLSV